MPESKDSRTICGREYTFVNVVVHASDASKIVLCRDTSGNMRYVTMDEWTHPDEGTHPDEETHSSEWTHSDERTCSSAGAYTSEELSCTGKSKLASVTRDSSWDEKISLIMSLFRGRTNVYAEGFVGKRTKAGKLSYWPLCSSRWTQGVCPRLTNPKTRCAECDHPSYVPLTREIVLAHCRGLRDARGRIQAIGIYVVDGDVCYFLAADFDGPGWKEMAAAYRDVCRRHKLFPSVERSRSGNGAHVWIFFESGVKASLARRVGEGLISEACDVCTDIGFRSYDRLFPLQTSVEPGSLGSPIALPLQGEAVRQGNSVFVDDQFEPLPDQCAYLSTIPKASSAHIATLAEEFGEDPIGLPKASSRGLTASLFLGNRAFPGDSVLLSNGVLDSERALSSDRALPSYRVDNGARNLRKGSLPSVAHVTISDGVRIRYDDMPAHVVNRLRRLAAFRNPEYGKKLRMHFSVWDTPRIVDISLLEGNELVLPRGCMDAALTTLRNFGVEPVVTDGRSEGRRIHAHFAGILRRAQQTCKEKLVAHDLGVLVAPTGFGKSVVAASVIATHQVSTLVIVPNTALLAQWRISLTKFLGIKDDPPVLLTPKGRRRKHQPGVVGSVGGGKNLRSGIVDIALASSLFEKGEVADDLVVCPFVGEYGMVIVDEAQHVAAAKMLEVLTHVRARYVYAMTATPKRDDGLDRILFLECGPLRFEVTVENQIAEQGMRRLLIPRFTMTRPDFEVATTWHAFMDYICTNEERNRLVVHDAIRALQCGRTPLILTRRVEHARLLASLITEEAHSLDVYVSLLVGSDSGVLRSQRLEELQRVSPERPLCVVATGSYVGEGFDLDRLDTLLLAGPVSFEGVLAQWVGRLHRMREGKAVAIVMDYVDPAIPMFDREWRNRLRTYKKLGYTTANEEDLNLVGIKGNGEPVGHLLVGKSFVETFADDLRDCLFHVVIASSWVRLARIKVLQTPFKDAVERGVSISVVLKEPSKPTVEWHQVVTMLRGLGCQVHAISGAAALDYAVFDEQLVCFGGVAPLAFPRKGDCSLRLVSREVAAALVTTGETGT